MADTRSVARADHESRPPDSVVDVVVHERHGAVEWVVTDSAQVAQLRFADRVQGSICLTPTWGDLAVATRNDHRLGHLVPAGGVLDEARARSPGSVIASRYVCLFPLPMMLGGAGAGSPVDVLVLGLGAGAGISLLAHHFPDATITCVEIDPMVADMACRHYPMLDWLASPGGPVRVVVDDTRSYADAGGGGRFDVVIVDCWAPVGGAPVASEESTFFAAIGDHLLADDGVVAVNVMGSYAGNNRERVSACLAALAAGGLTHRRCVPVLSQPGPFDPTRGSNILVLAAARPIEPASASGAWKAAASLELYAGLDDLPAPIVHRMIACYGDVERAALLTPPDSGAFAELRGATTPYGWTAPIPPVGPLARTAGARLDVPSGASLSYERRDLLRYARWAYSASVAEAHHDRHDGAAVADATRKETP